MLKMLPAAMYMKYKTNDKRQKKNTPIKLNDLSSKRWQRFVSSKIFKPSSHGTLIFGCLFYDKKKFIKIQVMLLNHNTVNFRFEDTNLLMKTELTGQKISFVGICFFFVVSCRVLISVFLLRTDMKSFPNWNKKTLFTWHCIDLFTSKYE